MDKKEQIKQVKCDIYTTKNENIGIKEFRGDLPKSINKWLVKYQIKTEDYIGLLSNYPSDFQNQNKVFLQNKTMKRGNPIKITKNNLIMASAYLSIRHIVKATWINDRDKFLTPNDGWKTDIEFQNNCLAYTLFHTQNRVTCKEGTNHWIPFKEKEVGTKAGFDSNFMTKYIAGKLVEETDNIFGVENITQEFPLEFSQEAQAVFDAGRELWKYYHTKYNNPTCVNAYNVNASFYDIREYFQGTKLGKDNKLKMNPKSKDQKYTKLLKILKEKMDILGTTIEPKIYQYQFLM